MAFEALSASLTLDPRDYVRGVQKATTATLGFGSTSESAFDDVGDEASEAGLKAKIAGSGFSALADAARGAVPDLLLFSSTVDKAGTEAMQAGRKARVASRGFASLSAGTGGVNARLGVMSSSLSSVLPLLASVPLILGPIGAIAGTVALGLGGIAIAFGAILASGFIAGGKKIKKTLAGVKSEVMGLVKQFGQKFVPLILDAIKALPKLIRSIIQAIGPLDKFKAALRKLGGVAMKLLPQIIGLFVDIGRLVLPIVAKIGKFVASNLIPALRGMVGVAKKSANTLKQLVIPLKFLWRGLKSLLPLLGPLIKSLRGLALVVAKAAINLTTVLIPALKPIIRILTKVVQVVKWAASIILPVFISIVDVVKSKFLVTMRNLKTTVTMIMRTIASVFGLSGGKINKTVRRMASVIQNTLIKWITILVNTVNKALFKIQSWWVKHKEQIRAVLVKLRTIVRRVFSTIRKVIRVLTGDAQAAVKKNFGGIKRIINGILNFVLNSVIRPVLSQIKRLWKIHGKEIMQSIRQLYNFIKWAFGKIRAFAIKVWSSIGNELISTVRFFTDMILSVAGAFADTLLTTFDVLTDILAGNWGEAWKKIKGLVSRLANGIARFLSKWGGRLASWLKSDLVPTLVHWFSELGRRAKKAVTGFFNGLVTWLKTDALNDLTGAARALGDAVAGAFKWGFNAILPDSIPIPTVTIGGGSFMGRDIPSVTVGGGSIDIPALATGGFIQSGGLAMLHSGERVVPAAEVDRRDNGTSGGSGIMVNVTLDTDDEALEEWVDENAKEVAVREVRDSFEQAKRRGSL